MVSNGDTVRVTGEVFEDLCRPTKGRFGVDEPVFVAQGVEPFLPSVGMAKVLKSSEKVELVAVESALKQGDELSPEEPAQDANGQEESVAATHPALSVEAESATGNDAVKMGMEQKVLPPGMEQRETAELSAEIFRVSPKCQQGIGSSPEQHRVEGTSVLKRERSELVREGEHDVEILHVKKFSLARVEPRGSCRPLAFRTVSIAARVVYGYFSSTGVTLFEVTP